MSWSRLAVLVCLTLTLLASACAPGVAEFPITEASPTVVVTPTAWETPTPWDCGWPYCGPTPSETPTPAAQTAESCTIVIRTPPPDAPTASSSGTPEPRQVDPHVEICASTPTLNVGDTVTVIGQAVDIGLPYFQISLKDEGLTEFAQLVEITYESQPRAQQDASQILELISVTADLNRVTAVLRARAAGKTEIIIGATGEVHYGYPGPATWAGGGSEGLLITITNP